MLNYSETKAFERLKTLGLGLTVSLKQVCQFSSPIIVQQSIEGKSVHLGMSNRSGI